MATNSSKSIHTYMSYGLPLDPSNVRTLVDLDLSYALGATLTEWSDSRELVSGIAKSWEISSKNEIVFKLRDGLKWSNGEPVIAGQVVASLNRAKKLHSESLKSLFEQIKEISAPEKNLIKFTLETDAANSGILAKLTEPMYGLLFIKENGDIDLSKTVGPFKLVSANEEMIELRQNQNWFKYNSMMAEEVLIKRPPSGEEVQDRFAKDEWVNLMTSSSLVEQSVNDLFIKQHFSIWNRSLDKIFFLSPGPRTTTAEGRELFKVLNKSLDRSILTAGLSGFNLSQQFFPSGYVLFDPEFKKGYKA